MDRSLSQFIVRLPQRAWKYLYLPLLKKEFGYFGKGVSIGKGFTFDSPQNMELEDYASIGPHCTLYAHGAKIHLGKYAMISPGVTMITSEHRSDLVGEYMKMIPDEMILESNFKPITIESDVWIGSNCTILKGVTIGRGSIVRAGNVITRNIKPYTVYISDKLQVRRFSDEEIVEHERLLKEKYSEL